MIQDVTIIITIMIIERKKKITSAFWFHGCWNGIIFHVLSFEFCFALLYHNTCIMCVCVCVFVQIKNISKLMMMMMGEIFILSINNSTSTSIWTNKKKCTSSQLCNHANDEKFVFGLCIIIIVVFFIFQQVIII